MGTTEIVALIVLAGFLLAMATWAVVAIRRSPYTRFQSLIYLVDVLFTRVLWRAEVIGEFPVPPEQGAVIICNHRSSVDPFFIQLMTGRLVHWMVAREYCEIPALRWFFRATGCIATRRGGVDTASTRTAMRHARAGELVGMLPEGRINDTSQFMLSGRPGAALVALHGRVPVVPCYLSGAPYNGTFWGCFFMGAKVRLTVGQPIDLSEYYDRNRNNGLLGEVTKRLMREIAVLGGHPDYEPQLAGRRWKPAAKKRP